MELNICWFAPLGHVTLILDDDLEVDMGQLQKKLAVALDVGLDEVRFMGPHANKPGMAVCVWLVVDTSSWGG